MTESTDSQRPNVNVEIGASARLNVELKTEIPKESSGRLVDAITDLIRPFSERRALKADKLRLQREEVLLEIAVRAKKRLEVENTPVRPIPNKLLVPFLERASLEDLSDSKLIEMWANLLATALSQEVELLGQYTDILSTITGNQVRIFEKIVNASLPSEPTGVKTGHFFDQYYYLNQTGLPGSVGRISNTKSAKVFGRRLYKEIDGLGVAIDTINVYYSDKPDKYSISITDEERGLYRDESFLDFMSICRLGLLDYVDFKKVKAGIFDFDAHYYIVTPLGIDLYACCNPGRISRENVSCELVNRKLAAREHGGTPPLARARPGAPFGYVDADHGEPRLLAGSPRQEVDGRDKPGHDGMWEFHSLRRFGRRAGFSQRFWPSG